jgi:hypothetical protein
VLLTYFWATEPLAANTPRRSATQSARKIGGLQRYQLIRCFCPAHTGVAPLVHETSDTDLELQQGANWVTPLVHDRHPKLGRTQREQLATKIATELGSMGRGRASLDANEAWRQFLKEGQDVTALQLAANDHIAPRPHQYREPEKPTLRCRNRSS